MVCNRSEITVVSDNEVTVYSTLIGDGVLCAMSDVLLTSDADGSHPTLPNLVDGFDRHTNGFRHVGATQKTILPTSRTLFQWAGSYITAMSIFTSIRRNKDSLFTGDKAPLEGYSAKELQSVSFLLCGFRSGKLMVYQHNCDRYRTEGMDEFTEGSASFLLDNTPLDYSDIVVSASKSSPLLIQAKRVMELILGEIGLYEYLSFRAGLWYELTALDRTLFRKIPYAILVWMKTDDGLSLERVSHSFYEHDTLFIRSFEIKEDAPTDLVHVVTSFRGKQPSDLRLSGLNQTKFSIQLVLNIIVSGEASGQIGSGITWSQKPQFELSSLNGKMLFSFSDGMMKSVNDILLREPRST